MKKIICTIILASSLLINQPAKAIIYDYTPLLPYATQVCYQCTPAVIATVLTSAAEVKSLYDKYKGGQLITSLSQNAKSYALSTANTEFMKRYNNVLSRKKVVSYSRTIEDSKLTEAGKIDDEGKVKEAFVKLFFQYPSNNGNVRVTYDNIGRQFVMDSTMEMYITGREMNIELKSMLAELDKIEKCLVAGEDCSEAGMEEYNCQKDGTEDKVCLARNALTAARIYDKIMRYNQFLSAMNAQYDAVRSINKGIKVLEFEADEKDKKKESSVEDLYLAQPVKTAEKMSVRTVASASVETKDDFDTLDDAGIESPVNKTEFDNMEVVAEATEKMNEAILAHNYKQSLPRYRDVFKTYYQMKEYHNKSKEILFKSEGCVLNYLSRYFNNPGMAWAGKSCSKTSDGYTCQKKVETVKGSYIYQFAADEDTEKGIYAWLKGLYNSAQDEANLNYDGVYTTDIQNGEADAEGIVNSVVSNGEDSIYISQELDMDSEGVMPLDKLKSFGNKAYQQDKDGKNSKAYKKPSIEDEVYAESRKSGLMNWTLGAEISRQINSDAINGRSDFGEVKAGYVVWNDVRNFYDAYLENKYENMKKYLSQETLLLMLPEVAASVKDTYKYEDIRDNNGKVIKTAAQQKAEDQQLVNKLLNSVKKGPEPDELDKLLEEENKKLSELTANYHKQLSALQNQKKTIYNEMDRDSTKLSDTIDELNQKTKIISRAGANNPESEDALIYGKKLERGSGVSVQRASYENSISENDEAKAKAVIEKNNLSNQTESLKRNIERNRERLGKIDRQISQVKADFVKDYNDMQDKYNSKIDKAAEDYQAKVTAYKTALDKLAETMPIISLISTLTKNVQEQAVALIDDSYQKIRGLGDKIYLPNNTDVAAIHKKLLQDLREMNIESDVYSVFAKAMAITLSKVAGEEKEVADSDYFVGLVARERDFMTPKTAATISAPFREIFHFDLEDYDTVLKYKKGGIDSEPASVKDITLVGPSFTESGLDIPEIWKYALRHRQFVEQRLDLTEFLKSEDSEELFRASGIYPCKVGNKYVTATDKAFKYTEPLPGSVKCTGLENFSTKKKSCPTAVLDVVSNVAQCLSVGAAENANKLKQGSELGQIVQVVEIPSIIGGTILPQYIKITKLSFNQALQDAVMVINKSTELDEEEGHQDYYNAKRMMFERNQFGDYLDNMEGEKMMAEVCAQQEIQVDKIKEELLEMFNSLGYTIEDDFDLYDEEDYRKAEQVLKDHKTSSLRRLKELTEAVNGTSNIIKHNKAKLQNAIKVLETDSEEKVQISAEDDLDELSEKMKTAEADQAVEEAYEEESDKAYERDIQRMQAPYCAVYP